MSGWIAGVDGCPAGWIVARRSLVAAHEVDIAVAPRFETLLDPADPPLSVAVDMPIGLPARIGAEGRGPERLIRAQLGARRSSVFAIPAKIVLGARDQIIPPRYTVGLPGDVAIHNFPELGHMPHIEAPDNVARLLRELMRSAG